MILNLLDIEETLPPVIVYVHNSWVQSFREHH